jgi:carboxypeptidase D
MLSALVSALAFVALGADALPWSSPHHWPGKPNTTYGPDWQDCTLCHLLSPLFILIRFVDYAVTLPLPNVTFPLQRSWAGSISADRPNMANNSHFFWAFEKSNGSFTAESAEPWGIFLAGGPGYSSIASLLLENGPIRVSDTYTLEPGPTPWTDIADWMVRRRGSSTPS